VNLVATVALTVLALALVLSLLRLYLGPTLGDRIIASDAGALIVINIVTVLGLRAHTRLYADVAAVIAILAFIGTVAAARYVRGRPPLV
jgi:multisubunit Na+/H+ antiporter MnhF subunit